MGETTPIIVKFGQVSGGREPEPEYSEPAAKIEDAPAPERQVRPIGLPRKHGVGHLPRQYPSRQSKPAAYRQNNYRERRERPDFTSSPPAQSKWWWSVPTALGIGVGLILGLVLLLFVKTVSFAGPADGPALNNQVPAESASIELPGYSIWLYQVGSFSDQTAADRQSAELKSKGVSVATRGTNPIQLVAGVAGSKVSSSTLSDALKQKSIDFYLKPTTADAQTVRVSGLSQNDSSHLKSLLDAMMGDAKTDIISLDSSAPIGSSSSTSQIQENADVQQLQKAGHRQAAADLQSLADQFHAATTALNAGNKLDAAAKLAAEQHLAEFYAVYDRFVQDLHTTDK
ncbi:MAG: hypothetical protein JWN30_887 [Bacilli bacterium]|nr:hypothetical protein [Bacilli bacterium]